MFPSCDPASAVSCISNPQAISLSLQRSKYFFSATCFTDMTISQLLGENFQQHTRCFVAIYNHHQYNCRILFVASNHLPLATTFKRLPMGRVSSHYLFLKETLDDSVPDDQFILPCFECQEISESTLEQHLALPS